MNRPKEEEVVCSCQRKIKRPVGAVTACPCGNLIGATLVTK